MDSIKYKQITTYLRYLSIVTLIIGASVAQGQSTVESEFLGMYTQRDVDSQAQLYILDNNTFCYTFMGGSLNSIKAGYWKYITDNKTINLQEIKLSKTVHPAMSTRMDRLGREMVGINFDGYSFGNAFSPVFAVNSTGILPSTFRPLFPDKDSSWAQTYALPLMAPEKARYIFIGDVKVDNLGRPSNELRLTEYKLENIDAVRIGFDKMQSKPVLNIQAQIIDNTLYVEGGKFGVRQLMSPDIIKQVYAQCISPVLNRVKDAKKKHHHSNESRYTKMLTPVKTFRLDTSVIAGKPIFNQKDDSENIATDSIEVLAESEKKQIQAAYNRALKGGDSVNKFFQLASQVIKKKNRKRIQLPFIVELATKLLVKQVSRGGESGDFKLPGKIFFKFVNNIYPFIEGTKNRMVKYNISVVASQGVILTSKLNNKKIEKIVFEVLLGKDFDIKSQKNKALIYNLACFYSINKNKNDMLLAIRQARKRGFSPRQFMNDPDFRSYNNDPDFLKAIKK